MSRYERIRLIPVDETVERGVVRRVPHPEQAREVIGLVAPVGMREFYESAASGYRLDGKATLYTDEYHAERMVEIGGRRYDVVRTYEAGQRMELTLQRVEGADSPAERR